MRPALHAFAAAVVCAAVAAIAACAQLTPGGGADHPAALVAADRGCDTCHAASAPPLGQGRAPLAPAWQEIADRYRRDSGARDALAAVLIGGTAERHWKGEPMVAMLPHEKWVSREEARALVDWILDR